MPWRESNLMDERLKFVARLLDGEKMAVVCREFGISRKTGYKIFNRYKDCGLEGLTDQRRRPYRHANQLPFQVERAILRMKQDRPSWGAPKIREKLIRTYPMITPPAKDWHRPKKPLPLPCLNGYSGNMACPMPFGPTMGFPSHHPMPCLV